MYEDRKKVGELGGEIGAIRLVLFLSLKKKNPIITPNLKKIVQSWDAFEDTTFKRGFEIVKF